MSWTGLNLSMLSLLFALYPHALAPAGGRASFCCEAQSERGQTPGACCSEHGVAVCSLPLKIPLPAFHISGFQRL